jgi:hypothetical protein
MGFFGHLTRFVLYGFLATNDSLWTIGFLLLNDSLSTVGFLVYGGSFASHPSLSRNLYPRAVACCSVAAVLSDSP